MIINPLTAIENGWVAHPSCNSVDDWRKFKFLSPNAIDFTIDRLFSISPLPFFLSEDDKVMRGGGEIEPSTQYIRRPSNDNPTHLDVHEIIAWELQGQTPYDGTSHLFVKVPENVIAITIIRSTLNRNGVFLTSGIFDQGFEGHLGFVIHNTSRGKAYFTPGTRVGQVRFEVANGSHMYEGKYNHSPGSHWTET